MKKAAKRFKLWKSRLSYSIYQRPLEALMYFILACLFLLQVMIITALSL